MTNNYDCASKIVPRQLANIISKFTNYNHFIKLENKLYIKTYMTKDTLMRIQIVRFSSFICRKF